eukprot:7851216-Alexandrium_andersonii.AAC.1
MPPPVGPGRNEVDVFEIGFACRILGTPDDGVAFRGVLACVLGQETYPDPCPHFRGGLQAGGRGPRLLRRPLRRAGRVHSD